MNFAYNVISPFMILLKSYSSWNFKSVNQPENIYPSLTGSSVFSTFVFSFTLTSNSFSSAINLTLIFFSLGLPGVASSIVGASGVIVSFSSLLQPIKNKEKKDS